MRTATITGCSAYGCKSQDIPSTVIVGESPSAFSVDFSLPILRFPAGSVRTNAMFQRSGMPAMTKAVLRHLCISSLVGRLIFLPHYPKGNRQPVSLQACTAIVTFRWLTGAAAGEIHALLNTRPCNRLECEAHDEVFLCEVFRLA